MDEYPFALLETLQAKQEAFFFKEALELYIPPQVGEVVGDDNPKDAAHAFGDWLNNPNKQCLLLLGDSGAGKTLFGQWLTRESFKKAGLQGRIPLFIPLLAQRHPDEGLIDRYLKKTCEIEDKNQREWIKQQPILLILDGFDEIHRKINLYRSNKLWQLRDVKIIISCRSQALEHIYDYGSLFYPCNSQSKPQPDQLQEYIVKPFNDKQINAYLQQYVSAHQAEIEISNPDWAQWETYQAHIQKLPGLPNLLTSPFVLSIVVQVLPSIIAKHQDKESIERLHLARINLYDHFVEQWFVRQRIKLLDAGHITDNCPIEELFIKCSKSIANAMLQNNQTYIELTLHTVSPLLARQGFFEAKSHRQTDTENQTLKYVDEEILVYGEKIKLSLILSGCPVMKLQDNQYAFLHKSLLEYFAARQLFEGVMADASIALGYELNERLLTNEPATLHFLAERVAQDDKLKQRLFDVLEESKFDERVEVAAANAITILNYAGVSFSQKALKRIRIKGADLSNAVLDSVDLRDADLREVNLRSAWLNHAKLGGALMQKVEFGELSYLECENIIWCVAYSPDGRYLAAAGSNGYISLWHAERKKLIVTLKGHTDGVCSLAFSPDGKILASGSWDHTVRFWDTLYHTSLSVMKQHTEGVMSVAFSPDGKFLASGSMDCSICLWDALNYKLLGVMKRHTEAVTCVAFNHSGKILASGSKDKTVYLWDALSCQFLNMLNEHTAPVKSVAFSLDGKLLASGSEDKSVRLWNTLSFQPLCVMNGHIASVMSLAFSSDSKVLASGGDFSIRLWDTVSYKLLNVMNGHKHAVTSIAFSPDGKILGSGSFDHSVRFWNILNYKDKALSMIGESTVNLSGVIFSPDGKVLAAGDQNGLVNLWNTITHKSLGKIKGPEGPVRAVAFSPDGKSLVSGSWDHSVRLWDVVSQQLLSVREGHTGAIMSVAFSPNGNIFASGGADCSVRLWDTLSSNPVGVINEHTAFVWSVAFSPNGKILASGGQDCSIRLWDTLSYKSIIVMNGHTNAVTCLAFSPDGKTLASGSADNTVRLWDALNYQLLSEWSLKTFKEAYLNWVINIAFSPDGKILAAGNMNNSVSLWDINAKKCINTIKLTISISGLAFKKEREKTCLCVSSGKVIYYFEIKTIQSKTELVLLWKIGNEMSLMSDRLDLGGVVELEAQHELLLKQHEAIGTLSTKETDKVLTARSQPVLYDPAKPMYDLFREHHLISPQNAIVSMVRKKGSNHAFLVIEQIEADHYVIIRADFVIDLRQKHSIGWILSSGQALIEVCVKPLSDMRELVGQCIYKCWQIAGAQAHKLLDNLEADRAKHIAYLNMGNSPLYGAKPNEETHSCITWCEKHLNKIGIDLSKQQSWLDAIVAHPIYHLPDEKADPNSIQNVSTLSHTEKPSLPPRKAKVQDNISNSVKPPLRELDSKGNEPDSREKCLMM